MLPDRGVVAGLDADQQLRRNESARPLEDFAEHARRDLING